MYSMLHKIHIFGKFCILILGHLEVGAFCDQNMFSRNPKFILTQINNVYSMKLVVLHRNRVYDIS